MRPEEPKPPQHGLGEVVRTQFLRQVTGSGLDPKALIGKGAAGCFGGVSDPPPQSGSDIFRGLLLGGQAQRPRMADQEAALDGNKMEREKYSPWRAPHVASYIWTDSPVLTTPAHPLALRVCHHHGFPCGQPREGAELQAPPPHPEASPEGKPGQACFQDLPTWGQDRAGTWFPRGL